MYIPKIFKVEDFAAVQAFIQSNGFGILINQQNHRPYATHIPLVWDQNQEGDDVLVGHIAKANPQWKSFHDHEEVLVIFSGPHAYISSSWYDHENVPTWNYQAVHVYGKVKIIQGDYLLDKMRDLVDKYEKGLSNPVSVDKMSHQFVEQEMKGIVGVEILVTEIQAVSKLSQNRDHANYQHIIDGLEGKGDDESLKMAHLMKNRDK